MEKRLKRTNRVGLLFLAAVALLSLFQMTGYARQVAYESASDSLSRGEEERLIARYERGAQYGNIKAQYRLALLYANRSGDPQSMEKAVSWMEKSAVGGYAPAQRVLGQWYLLGVITEKDIAEAVKWISMAAKRGDDIAMYTLGRMYATGTGVQRNISEGLRWFRLARANGFPVPEEYFTREGIENLRPISREEVAGSSRRSEGAVPVSTAGKDLIRKVQEGLDLLGYEPGAIDGVYGEKTRRAVELFQENFGISVDGLITEALLKDIEGEVRKFQETTEKGSESKPEEKDVNYITARELYDNGKYDEVIRLLSRSTANRDDYDSNMLLARAQLKKCAMLKENGDRKYGLLVQEPYKIGLKYQRSNPTLHEPYYIIAMSLFINNRPNRAASSINRAIRLDPGNAEYYLLSGDVYHDMLRREKDRNIWKDFYMRSRASYERALEVSGDNDDFALIVQKRLESLTATMKPKQEDVGY